MNAGERPELYKPAEVAALFRVSPNTVNRWAVRGVIPSILTPGGRRRYPAAEIDAILAGTEPAQRDP